MKKKLLLCILSPLLMLFVSCPPPNLPVQSIFFTNDGAGFLRFYTNDPQYLGYAFYEPDLSPNQAPMTVMEIQTKKISGAASMGFGAVFCWQDINNFYSVISTIDGYYKIFRRLSGSITNIQDWTYSNNVNKNYGVVNTIKVTYNGGNNFTLYFNNVSTLSFSNSSFTGGKAGFLASISPSESFPNIPVDIRYKMLQPAVVP